MQLAESKLMASSDLISVDIEMVKIPMAVGSGSSTSRTEGKMRERVKRRVLGWGGIDPGRLVELESQREV